MEGDVWLSKLIYLWTEFPVQKKKKNPKKYHSELLLIYLYDI